MALSPGWIEVGPSRSEMKKLNYEAGEMGVCPRHLKVWLGAHGMERLILTISDPALKAANDGISGDVELRGVHKLAMRDWVRWWRPSMRRGSRGFRAGGCFWTPFSRRLRWRWSIIMRSGAHHRGYIEAG